MFYLMYVKFECKVFVLLEIFHVPSTIKKKKVFVSLSAVHLSVSCFNYFSILNYFPLSAG